MQTKYKFGLVALVCAILAFSLSLKIWPDPVGMPGPSEGLVPYFIVVSILECVAFGVGIAFLLFGYPLVSRLGGPKGLTVVAFLAITWELVSWWPHDNMHRVNDMGNFAGLLRIEYTFHVTLVIAGIIIAAHFWRSLVQAR